MDKTVKTIGYLWNYFFINKKYDGKLEKIGNYRIFTKNIGPKSIIYSFGIGNNISFDEVISNKYGCDVLMYDPTKLGLELMKSIENPKLKFFNFGIWKFDGNIKFFYTNESDINNFSATNFFRTSNYVNLPCQSVASLMKEHNHKKIYPEQIVVELERPFFIYNASFIDLISYLIKRRKLHKRLNLVGYELIELDANELLALKFN